MVFRVITFSLLFSTSVAAQPYVPDAKTAVAIAEAILKPIFGEKLVDQIKPFTATQNGDVWLVVSTPNKIAPGIPEAVVVKINRETGAIVDWSTVH